MKDFLACTELVTLVHHVKTAASDSYVCYPIQGVSWYAKTETAVTADGAKAVNVYKVRIPEAVLPSCLPEKLVFGAWGNYYFCINVLFAIENHLYCKRQWCSGN